MAERATTRESGSGTSSALPDNDAWLAGLVGRSPLLPEASLRRHWQRLVAWLPNQARYELAAILLDAEHAALDAR